MTTEEQSYCPECFESFPAEMEECPEHKVPFISLPADESLVGKVVDGKYQILERVGQGGMGTVYRAKQKYINREVALKVLRSDFAKDVSAVKRFFVEARAACQLRNRHSVILYDFGLSEEKLLFYTMEFLNGLPLSQTIKEEGPLKYQRAVQLTVDVCRSLAEAHSHGIVHRDLKPDNIMVVRDGEEDIAKVLDFGIAKLLTQADGASLTKTGMICGTPEYMSPEQATGRELGPASDIYSLGIVLYEMLSGSPPFQGATPVLVLMKHVSEVPKPIGHAGPDIQIPTELNRLLACMLSKEASSRPADAKSLAVELRKLLKEGERQAGTVGMPQLTTAPTGTRELAARREKSEDLSGLDRIRLAEKLLASDVDDHSPEQTPAVSPRPSVSEELRPDVTPKEVQPAPDIVRTKSERPAPEPAVQRPPLVESADTVPLTDRLLREIRPLRGKRLVFSAIAIAIAVVAATLAATGFFAESEDSEAREETASVRNMLPNSGQVDGLPEGPSSPAELGADEPAGEPSETGATSDVSSPAGDVPSPTSSTVRFESESPPEPAATPAMKDGSDLGETEQETQETESASPDEAVPERFATEEVPEKEQPQPDRPFSTGGPDNIKEKEGELLPADKSAVEPAEPDADKKAAEEAHRKARQGAERKAREREMKEEKRRKQEEAREKERKDAREKEQEEVRKQEEAKKQKEMEEKLSKLEEASRRIEEADDLVAAAKRAMSGGRYEEALVQLDEARRLTGETGPLRSLAQECKTKIAQKKKNEELDFGSQDLE